MPAKTEAAEGKRRREKRGEARRFGEIGSAGNPAVIPQSLSLSLSLSLCIRHGRPYNSLQMYTTQQAPTMNTTMRAISHGVTTPMLIL